MALTGVVVVVTFMLNVLQIIYGSKSVSPLDTHPKIMLIAISSFLLYCFSCYLKHHLTSVFRYSTWPALLIYNNFMRFLGFVSMVSLASIIFSTSSTSLAIVYLLLFLFFSGKSGLYLIQNRNSLHAILRRSNNNCSNIYMQDNRVTNLISMVEHDMVKMKSMVEVEFPLGRMNEILDVELGLGTHCAALESLLGNFGRGEGKDGPNPESREKVKELKRKHKEIELKRKRKEIELKRKRKECMSRRGKAPAKLGGQVNAKKRRGALAQKGIVIPDVVENNSGIVTNLGFPQDNTKGKSKMVGEKLLFNNNGLWSQEAIAALEKGKDENKKLRKMVLNLEDKVTGNVRLADWLEKATQDQHGLMLHAENKSQLLEETSEPYVWEMVEEDELIR